MLKMPSVGVAEVVVVILDQGDVDVDELSSQLLPFLRPEWAGGWCSETTSRGLTVDNRRQPRFFSFFSSLCEPKYFFQITQSIQIVAIKVKR